jgi:malonyl-CoA/methylmalonyl-CoA synthetase
MQAAQVQAVEFDNVARGPQDLAAILYTSGTTGLSKGAMLSHDNLYSNSKTLVDYWQFTADDVLLHALPIFHTHGLFVATNVIMIAGGSMIFLARFDLEQMIEQLPGATALMGVPTFYTRLLADQRFDCGLVSHIRLFVSGSAPMLAETHVEFEQRTGHRILERYGMTETNMNTSNPYLGERRAGSVGFPLPGVEIKISDAETGVELPAGETGMIEVRGPNVFLGYWRKPEKTALELRDNGFFISGDLGKIDADGYLHILGREKDLIISGGYNIYPRQVETEIDALDGVLESAVFGIAHTDLGEAVAAAVVPFDGVELDGEQLIEALEPVLARFKLPRKVFIIDELPRNAMGKVQKNMLRESYG